VSLTWNAGAHPPVERRVRGVRRRAWRRRRGRDVSMGAGKRRFERPGAIVARARRSPPEDGLFGEHAPSVGDVVPGAATRLKLRRLSMARIAHGAAAVELRRSRTAQ
jgi:hypothetical protein